MVSKPHHSSSGQFLGTVDATASVHLYIPTVTQGHGSRLLVHSSSVAVHETGVEIPRDWAVN